MDFEMSPHRLAKLQTLFEAAKQVGNAKFFINKYSKLPASDRCHKYGMNDHRLFGGCSYCCETCNYDRHICHFCGDNLHHNSLERSPALGPIEHSCTTSCAQCGVVGHEHHNHRDPYDDWKEYHHPWVQPSMERVPPSTIVGRTDV